MQIRLHPTPNGEKHNTTSTTSSAKVPASRQGRDWISFEGMAPILLLLSGDFPSLGDGCVQPVEHLDGRLSGTAH
jgi:hypothetical protein